jgi:hypothetical protein
VAVRERVEVVLSRQEVEHCLRCWLNQKLAPVEAPAPKEFNKVEVHFEVSGIDDHASLDSVMLIYDPAPRELVTVSEGEP